MKKYVIQAAQVSATALFLAMRDYFQARREGDQKGMDEQLQLAEACVQSMENEEFLSQTMVEADGDWAEEMDGEDSQPLINVPKWYN